MPVATLNSSSEISEWLSASINIFCVTSAILPGLDLELLEQRAQRQRLALAAIGQDRRRRVRGAIDLPIDDRWRRYAGEPALAPLALDTALAPLAGLALADQELPAGARARTGIVLLGDEARTVQRHDVEAPV